MLPLPPLTVLASSKRVSPFLSFQGLPVSVLCEPGCCGMTALPFPFTSVCLEDTLGMAQKRVYQVLNPAVIPEQC